MWKSLMLLGLCLLLLIPNSSWALPSVPCGKPIYVDCKHYCNLNCHDMGVDCMLNCDNGCGCEPAYVHVNNGGCYKVHECVFDDKTDEEPESVPTPCQDIVWEKKMPNGEEPPNLVEFSTLNPHG